MLFQSLITLAISLLLGLPCTVADPSAALLDTAYVEIADTQTPLAGPAEQSLLLHRIQAAQEAQNQPFSAQLSSAPGQEPSGGSGSGASTGNNGGVTDPVTEPQPPTEQPPTEQPPTEQPPTEQPPTEQPPTEQPPAPATPSVAQKLLERAYALLTQYNAAPTPKDKKAVLEANNYALGNDAFRKKLLADQGGAWEQVETEVVGATQYQQDKTLYAQVYMAGLASDFTPVVYATQNPDLTGNQWATNLVYDEATATWMEYVKQHPYNNSRVSYGMTSLAQEGALEGLQETMQTSELWAEVAVPEPDITLGALTCGEAGEAGGTPEGTADGAAEGTAAGTDESATDGTPDGTVGDTADGATGEAGDPAPADGGAADGE